MKRFGMTTLSLLLAGSLAGCFSGAEEVDSEQQLLRGTIPLSQYSSKIVGVRVIANGQAVATAPTDTAGNFNISVPRGENYTFEVITLSGSRTLLAGPINSNSPTTFDVCDPGEDFDLGDLTPFDFETVDGDDQPFTGEEGADCEIPPWICGDDAGDEPCWEEPLPCEDPAASPEFCFEEPLPCEEAEADADFCWGEPVCDYPGDCEEPPIEPPFSCENPEDCEPTEPPFPCNDLDGEDCEPELPPPFPCENPEDCEPEPEPPHPCENPEDCEPEPEPPLPCENPEDCEPTEPPLPPEECQDPSGEDCGWVGECTSTYDDPSCWPEPGECTITPDGEFEDCDNETGAAPEFPLPDFGCE